MKTALRALAVLAALLGFAFAGCSAQGGAFAPSDAAGFATTQTAVSPAPSPGAQSYKDENQLVRLEVVTQEQADARYPLSGTLRATRADGVRLTYAINCRSDSHDVGFADFDGDGLPEIVFFDKEAEHTRYDPGVIYVFRVAGTEFEPLLVVADQSLAYYADIRALYPDAFMEIADLYGVFNDTDNLPGVCAGFTLAEKDGEAVLRVDNHVSFSDSIYRACTDFAWDGAGFIITAQSKEPLE